MVRNFDSRHNNSQQFIQNNSVYFYIAYRRKFITTSSVSSKRGKFSPVVFSPVCDVISESNLFVLGKNYPGFFIFFSKANFFPVVLKIFQYCGENESWMFYIQKYFPRYEHK